MNNTIILKALQSQLETVKAAAIAHEQDVYEPAVAKLTEKVKTYFEQYVFQGIYNVSLYSESIVIKPSDTTGYGNDITINYRASWRGDYSYFETSSYRPDLDSREDNTIAKRYHKCMAAVADCFELICDQYKTKWMPAFKKLEDAKSEQYSAIYALESEIRKVEKEISETEKAVYNQTGFECTLKPMTTYNSNYEDNKAVYTKVTNDHAIRAQYGRAKWDYFAINSFKVLSFPKAKHGKVVIEYKSSKDDIARTAILNKQRYADFVNEVYNWQSEGAEKREAMIDERIADWNK